MATKKFYSNKKKTGWRENPGWTPPDKLKKDEKQKESQKKYYSWGYDVDLEPVEFHPDGAPKRHRRRDAGFANEKHADAAAARLRLAEKDERYELSDRRAASPYPMLPVFFQKRIDAIKERQERVRAARVLQLLLDALEENDCPGLRLDQLETAHVNFYVKRRQQDAETAGKTLKDETINRDLRTVRATLRDAPNIYPGLKKYVAPKINFLKVDKSRREKVLSSAEAQLIVGQMMKPRAEDESQPVFLSRRRAGLLFALSLVTGARPGELVALKENDILEDINMLKITGRKTRYKTAKTVRYFPLINIVRQILVAAIQIKIAEYIFSRRGTLTATYYDNVKTAVTAAGLKYGRKTPGGIIPYDLRHTATTLLMQSGADFETVTNITGQSRHTLWHYTHASRESIDRAASVLELFGEKSLEKIKNGLGLDKQLGGENLSLTIAANEK